MVIVWNSVVKERDKKMASWEKMKEEGEDAGQADDRNNSLGTTDKGGSGAYPDRRPRSNRNS